MQILGTAQTFFMDLAHSWLAALRFLKPKSWKREFAYWLGSYAVFAALLNLPPL